MKIIYNYIIPFKGYLAMCVFPFIFVRKDARNLTVKDINHEKIHGMQQIETHIVVLILAVLLAAVGLFSWWWLFAIPFAFYAWYVLEWLIRIPLCGFDSHLAYYNISTEQEAYLNEDIVDYNSHRKPFNWLRFLFKNSFTRDKVTRKIVKKQ